MPPAAADSASAPAASGLHVRRIQMTAHQRAHAPSVRQPASQEMAEREGAASLLHSFLYPLQPEEFMRDIWTKQALHIAYDASGDASTAATTTSVDANAASASKKRKSKSPAAAPSSAAGGVADRMAYVKRAHLFHLDAAKLVEETASESIHVWMRSAEAANSSAAAAASPSGAAALTALHSFELDSSNPGHLAAALTLHSGGSSLYFRSPPPMVDEYVAGLADDLGMNFAALFPADSAQKGEIEVFLSRAGHVTDWHCDFQQNFTLQLKGTKTWHLKRSTIRHPIRGATPHYKTTETEEQQLKVHALVDSEFNWESRPRTRVPHSKKPAADDEEYDTVVLRPGDCFYHPAGIWHRVECDADSISVNISLISTDWATLVTDAMRQRLWTADALRAGIAAIQGPKQARNYLDQHLAQVRALVNSLRSEDYLPACLFLPRQSHFVVQATPLTDETAHGLCARATLQEAGEEEEEEAAASSKKNKKSTSGTAAPSTSSSSSPPRSPSMPLLASAVDFDSAVFRVNPLCVLLRYEHDKQEKKAEQEREEKKKQKTKASGPMEEDDEEDQEADEEMLEQEDDDDDDEDEDESASVASSAEPDDGESKVGYVLHFSFGNESLDSAVRVTFDVSQSLVPDLEQIRRVVMHERRETFAVGDLRTIDGSATTSGAKRKDAASAAAGRKKQKVHGGAAATGNSNGDAGGASGLHKLLFFLAHQGAIHLQ